MSRIKISETETTEELNERTLKETIANKSNRNEKISWNRKMDNMVILLSQIHPIENEILELHLKKQPIFDQIQELRNQMVNECVHPFEYLVTKADHVHCKFCDKKINGMSN